MTPRRVQCSERMCGRGTFLGAAADASLYGFAPCALPAEHRPPCDSGPAPEPELDEQPRAA